MPHPVDEKVGAKVRLLRTARGLSQTELGKKLEVSFQQVQKYESGANRISASRLHELSRIFDVEVNELFALVEKPADAERQTPASLRSQRISRYFEAIPQGPSKDLIYYLLRALSR